MTTRSKPRMLNALEKAHKKRREEAKKAREALLTAKKLLPLLPRPTTTMTMPSSTSPKKALSKTIPSSRTAANPSTQSSATNAQNPSKTI